MTSPLVSIIIPAHNEERWIASCIKSFLAQTYRNFEIIIVDDHSSDKTREIAQSFPEIKLIKMEKLSGEANVRTLGAQSAQGAIIIQTDCDAVYPPEFIESTLSYFKDEKVDGLSVGRIFVLEDRKGIIADYFRVKREASFLVRSIGKKAPAGCFAMRKSSFEKNGPYDPKMIAGTDVDFSKRMQKNGMQIIWAKGTYFAHADPDTLSVFLKRMWNGSVYGKNFQKKWGEWPTGQSFFIFVGRTITSSLIPICVIFAFWEPIFFLVALILFSIEGVAPLLFFREQRIMLLLTVKQKKYKLLMCLPFLLFLQLRASAYGKLYVMLFKKASENSITFDVKE